MLSINIPVFNFEINGLVSKLIEQAEQLGILFEIRVYDDGSDVAFKIKNRLVRNHPYVVYVELEKNIGRSAIRNKMGEGAKYKYLLFIDADSDIIEPGYLSVFLENVRSNRVLCGGTAYKPEKPIEAEKLLRWVYGTKREAISANMRNSKKGFIITSNNFLIEKSVFEKIRFREDIKKYGHEDTLLGYDLYRNGIDIFHIDNPVEHTGLEDSSVFLEKTKTALENLNKITRTLLATEDDFVWQVHFLNRYSKICKFIPAGFLRMFYKISHRIIERNLLGKTPRLLLFDLYKVGFYAALNID